MSQPLTLTLNFIHATYYTCYNDSSLTVAQMSQPSLAIVTVFSFLLTS